MAVQCGPLRRRVRGGVEFADGNLWIPGRSDITNADIEPSLKHAIGSSPEQQRLVEIYRRKGMNAFASELAKSKD